MSLTQGVNTMTYCVVRSFYYTESAWLEAEYL